MKLFGLARTILNLFECVRRDSNAVGYIQMGSNAFRHFSRISKKTLERSFFEGATQKRTAPAGSYVNLKLDTTLGVHLGKGCKPGVGSASAIGRLHAGSMAHRGVYYVGRPSPE